MSFDPISQAVGEAAVRYRRAVEHWALALRASASYEARCEHFRWESRDALHADGPSDVIKGCSAGPGHQGDHVYAPELTKTFRLVIKVDEA